MEEKENIAVVKGFWHWMDGQLKSKDLLCKMCVYCLPSVSRDPFFFLSTSEDFSSICAAAKVDILLLDYAVMKINSYFVVNQICQF